MFKEMYLLLSRRITDAIEALRHGNAELAKATLIHAQQDAEELYIEGKEE